MATVDKSTEKHEIDPGRRGSVTLPPFPGQDALLHEAMHWREVRDDMLTEARLLHVAKGGEPAGIDEIVDVPIDAIPAVPPGLEEDMVY